jgi:hypothetical protein
VGFCITPRSRSIRVTLKENVSAQTVSIFPTPHCIFMSKLSFFTRHPFLLAATRRRNAAAPRAATCQTPGESHSQTSHRVSDTQVLDSPLPTESPIVLANRCAVKMARPLHPLEGPTPVWRAFLSLGSAMLRRWQKSGPRWLATQRAAASGYWRLPVHLLRHELGASIPLWPLMRDARLRTAMCRCALKCSRAF